MRYAETGVSLEVDLSRGTVEKVKSDPRLTELYLGGLGINAKIAWDRVPPETTPFSPENVLIFGPGLLVGTLIPGANRTVVSSFTPVNNFFAFSMMGGFWGAELKHAGYDRIVIRGKAPELVYLWIKNDKVELRDARHLRGKGTYETTVLLQEELGDKRFQIVCIGPAGENRVYMASVNHNWATAARGGLGAVMGDKNLKAIAVRGTKDIFIARPREFFEAAMRLRREIHNNPNLGDWMAYT
ncbi:MAG: aldehyde dehydrogenase, partial [Deltaproteobacteria bacterium]